MSLLRQRLRIFAFREFTVFRKIVALLTVALVFSGVLLWVLVSDNVVENAPARIWSPGEQSGNSGGHTRSVGQPDSQRVAFSVENLRSAETNSHGDNTWTCQIYSSTRLPLQAIEMRTEGSAWEQLPIIPHTLPNTEKGIVVNLPAHNGRVVLRAPGHVEHEWDHSSTSVELQPDALLELDIPGFRAAATAVELPLGHGESTQPLLASTSLWGFVDADRFALAQSVDRYRAAFGENSLGIRFSLGLFEELVVEVKSRPGTRVGANLKHVMEHSQVAPLNVDIIADSATWDSATSVIEVWSEKVASDVTNSIEYDWGTVEFRRNREPREYAVAHARTTIERLPTGFPYRVAVTDSVTGAAGVAEFDHTGAPVPVRLLPGVSITGSFYSQKNEVPQSARASWSWGEAANESGDEKYKWINDSSEVEIGRDGSWSLSLPRRGFPGRPPRSLMPPSTVDLYLDVPGFEPAELTVELQGRFDVDLAPIELVCIEPDFVLVSHPFAQLEDLSWSPVVVSGIGEVGTFEVGGVRRDDEGGLSIYLNRNDRKKRRSLPRFRTAGETRFNVELPHPPSRALIIEGRVGEARDVHAASFELVESGSIPSYAVSPSSQQSVEVLVREVPQGVGDVLVGWEWRDAFVVLRRIRDTQALNASIGIDFEAPEGASIWWSWSVDGSFVWPPIYRGKLPENGGTLLIK